MPPKPDQTRILAIETSCDETAAAVVQDGRLVLSNVIASQHDLHAEYGGVVPEIASRAHAERILPIVRAALREAGLTLRDVSAVAVGHRPGLIGSLLVGVAAAKALAWSLDVPLIGVDHVHAHLYAGLLSPLSPASRVERPLDSTRSPSAPAADLFPALGLVVSGGHTSLYRLASPIDLTRLGATVDDAMGEAFDKAATILGLPYPGGPNLDKLASNPGANDRALALPVSRLGRESLDFSFSGLKTALLYAVRGLPEPGGVFTRDHTALTERQRADFAASFQRAAVEAAVLKLGRALDRRATLEAPPDAANTGGGTPYASILAGGGVVANSLLRSRLQDLARERGVALRLPAMEFCVDNAAMIGGLAHHLLRAGRVSDLGLAAVPTAAV